MKTAVLHDYFENAEGGGRLALLLAKELQADLIYGFKATSHIFSADFPSLKNQFPLSRNITIPLLRQCLLGYAFSHKTALLSTYDKVIYSGWYSPLAVKNSSHKGLNVYYCHTPPRFIYDQKEFYFSQLPFCYRPLLKSFIRYLQPRYEDALAKMDVIITNSENVRKRIQKFLGMDAVVVFPPCNVDRYSWRGCEEYYLSTARLDPLKRVDLIVKAFVKMPEKKLIVASGGSEMSKLKKLAHGCNNIIFTDWVEEEYLLELIGNAIATIYIPKDEDFGLSPIESMAAGKPVIGVEEGGLCETILDGRTGILISSPPGEDDIVGAVRGMTVQKAQSMRYSCEEHAAKFRKEIFLNKMKTFVQKRF